MKQVLIIVLKKCASVKYSMKNVGAILIARTLKKLLKIHIEEEKICLIYIVIYVNFIRFKKH